MRRHTSRGTSDRRAAATGLLLIAGLLTAAFGCAEASSSPEQTYERETKQVDVRFERDTVVPTSVLKLELVGTERIVPDAAKVTLTGKEGPYRKVKTQYSGTITRRGDVGNVIVQVPVAETLWSDLNPKDGTVFTGRILVELTDELGVAARGSAKGNWVFRESLQPSLRKLRAGKVYVNERLSVQGAGFLRPEEGQTRAVVVSGELKRNSGSTEDLTGERIALRWTGSREKAVLPLDPGVFGVRPGSFTVELRFENQLGDGTLAEGRDTVSISGTIQKSYIATLSPPQGSRGQKITVRGRGFVPSNSREGYGMYFQYEGKLDPRDANEKTLDYKGKNAATRVPDRVVSEARVEQSIWYSVENRKLRGLGATPGTFDGTITPVLFDESGEQRGVPWRGTFEILPTKQVIYLKYLPAFSEALERYGLASVEGAIRDRVREVVERDYGSYHVDVREEKPTDFLDYATIELGGPDPSGTRAFGFDNSFNGVAKDTGNLYLADYLGGVNAEAAEEFNNPYGGVFLASFTYFSAELSGGSRHASKAFDRIIGPFMPELGGKPVRGTEWPKGPRVDKIERAVHMVGSVVGNTVTHEIGHSMGMTFVRGDFDKPQDVFHNRRPGPYVMDAGSERPFEERAEIEGAGPARFNPQNREYLEEILPEPE